MSARKSRRGGRRVGAGRKSLPVEERLRNSVNIRLADWEYEALVEAAQDTRPSTYVREVLVRHLKRREYRQG